MSHHAQFQYRVKQALATDAQVAGVNISGLGWERVLQVTDEIAALYPAITYGDITEAVNRIRAEDGGVLDNAPQKPTEGR